MDSVQVDTSCVIKLIAQFLKENRLMGTLAALQAETQVPLNYVESREALLRDVKRGSWDRVLAATKNLVLGTEALCELYEHIILELCENREIGAAKTVLRHTEVMRGMAEADPDRYLRLEELVGKPYFDAGEAYGNGSGGGRAQQREKIGQLLAKEVTVVDSSRLLTLLGQAVKYQKEKGLLPGDIGRVDLFEGVKGGAGGGGRGKAPGAQGGVEKDAIPHCVLKSVKFSKGVYAQSVVFDPNGSCMVSGCVDGVIEVRNSLTGKVRKDLGYQKEGNFMLMSEAVVALGMSSGGDMLASASSSGQIRVWNMETGKSMRKFSKVHEDAITSVCFTPSNGAIVSSSLDGTIKVHGLLGGRTLKEFKGHQSFVSSVHVCASGEGSDEGLIVVSGSADGMVKIWDFKSTQCQATLDFIRGDDSGSNSNGTSIRKIAADGSNITICKILEYEYQKQKVLFACSIIAFNLKGEVLHIISLNEVITPEKRKSVEGINIVSATLSSAGKYLYLVAGDGNMYCLELTWNAKMNHNKLEEQRLFSRVEVAMVFPVEESGTILGVEVLPGRNVMTTFGTKGMHLWQ
eukprot:Nk52_evm5s276 gene=Nk52_evmTU5s276